MELLLTHAGVFFATTVLCAIAFTRNAAAAAAATKVSTASTGLLGSVIGPALQKVEPWLAEQGAAMFQNFIKNHFASQASTSNPPPPK